MSRGEPGPPRVPVTSRMSGTVRWHARVVDDTVLSAVDDQPDTEPTPTDDEVERCHALDARRKSSPPIPWIERR